MMDVHWRHYVYDIAAKVAMERYGICDEAVIQQFVDEYLASRSEV